MGFWCGCAGVLRQLNELARDTVELPLAGLFEVLLDCDGSLTLPSEQT
jgi:hypothetical protein